MKQNYTEEIDYTIKSLSDFIEGSGEEWDWDTYTSVSLKDPQLNAVRKKALMVELPLDDQGREELEGLLRHSRQQRSAVRP